MLQDKKAIHAGKYLFIHDEYKQGHEMNDNMAWVKGFQHARFYSFLSPWTFLELKWNIKYKNLINRYHTAFHFMA